jgi:hypothetical protein
VAQDDHLIVTKIVFAGRKGAALGRVDAERRKETGRDSGAVNALRFVRAREVHVKGTVGRQTLEQLALQLPVKIIGGSNRAFLSIGDGNKPLQRRQRERVDEESFGDAEDGGVDADAESQCDDGGRRKARVFPKHTQAKAEILQQGFKDRQTAAFAVGFLGLLDAAEFHDGLPPRLHRRHASAQIVFEVKIQVALHLSRKLAVAELPAK